MAYQLVKLFDEIDFSCQFTRKPQTKCGSFIKLKNGASAFRDKWKQDNSMFPTICGCRSTQKKIREIYIFFYSEYTEKKIREKFCWVGTEYIYFFLCRNEEFLETLKKFMRRYGRALISFREFPRKTCIVPNILQPRSLRSYPLRSFVSLRTTNNARIVVKIWRGQK